MKETRWWGDAGRGARSGRIKWITLATWLSWAYRKIDTLLSSLLPSSAGRTYQRVLTRWIQNLQGECADSQLALYQLHAPRNLPHCSSDVTHRSASTHQIFTITQSEKIKSIHLLVWSSFNILCVSKYKSYNIILN